MSSRILFLCARGSGRALLAASILYSVAAHRFDIWNTPLQDAHEYALVETVLQEQAITPLAPDHFTQPAFGLQWDEGVILCSGMTDT